MVLRGINRTVWGTRLLPTPDLASFVDCISLCHKLKAQHCSLSLSDIIELQRVSYVTIFGKIDHLRASTGIHFLLVHERYIHSETPSTRR